MDHSRQQSLIAKWLEGLVFTVRVRARAREGLFFSLYKVTKTFVLLS